MPARDGDDSRNELSGSAKEVIQAGSVTGGIHFHGTGRTDDGVPRQLPANVPGFVNRHGELEQLDLLLPDESDDGRAMAPCVVVGTAGVGKTSLAVHWAHRTAPRFPDGQLYVNLHGYDPGRSSHLIRRWIASCARWACPASRFRSTSNHARRSTARNWPGAAC